MAFARLIELVFPQQTNHHGTLFGGEGLALMDRAAFLAASRHARRSFVTASSQRVDFKAPARLGEMVEVAARVIKIGRTSITTQIDLVSEELLSGARKLCTQGEFVLVATDGKEPLPPLGDLPEAESDPADARFAEIIFPGATNHYGTLFGGTALAFMGKAAFVAATRHSRRVVVMAASEHIDFRAPALQGEMVELSGCVIRTGRSSMIVAVAMEAENLLTGERRLCAKGEFTMVAVDQSGRPAAVAGG